MPPGGGAPSEEGGVLRGRILAEDPFQLELGQQVDVTKRQSHCASRSALT